MAPEQLKQVETALHSEKAKQILGDDVTTVLGTRYKYNYFFSDIFRIYIIFLVFLRYFIYEALAFVLRLVGLVECPVISSTNFRNLRLFLQIRWKLTRRTMIGFILTIVTRIFMVIRKVDR